MERILHFHWFFALKADRECLWNWRNVWLTVEPNKLGERSMPIGYSGRHRWQSVTCRLHLHPSKGRSQYAYNLIGGADVEHAIPKSVRHCVQNEYAPVNSQWQAAWPAWQFCYYSSNRDTGTGQVGVPRPGGPNVHSSGRGYWGLVTGQSEVRSACLKNLVQLYHRRMPHGNSPKFPLNTVPRWFRMDLDANAVLPAEGGGSGYKV